MSVILTVQDTVVRGALQGTEESDAAGDEGGRSPGSAAANRATRHAAFPCLLLCLEIHKP